MSLRRRFFIEKLGFFEGGKNMGFDLIKGFSFKWVFGEKKKIVLGFKVLKMGADGFPKKAFESVSVYSSFSYLGGDNKADPGKRLIGKRDFQTEKRGVKSSFRA